MNARVPLKQHWIFLFFFKEQRNFSQKFPKDFLPVCLAKILSHVYSQAIHWQDE